jgi:hypothetical protein
MNPAATKSTQFIVVGAGALGLLLADSLCQSSQISAQNSEILLLNRRQLPQPIRMRAQANPIAHDLAARLVTDSPEDVVESIDARRVSSVFLFLCLPPEHTEALFFDWLEAFHRTRPNCPVHFVFCNNGLLSSEVLKKVSENSEQISFLRAIFFVGAVRQFEAGACTVQWNGGDLVRWGFVQKDLYTNIKTPGYSTSPWLQATKGACSMLGFLRWNFEENTSKLEREKFFTNFMLAAFIGPRREINKTLLTQTTVSERAQIARTFENLWTHSGVTAETLIQNLTTTVELTSENVNSLSLQGAQGETSTMCYFLKTLEDDISAHAAGDQMQSLTRLIQNARILWGLKA